ncbi:MAG: FABP family protein [Actinomycetota bacterium]
MGQIHNDLEPLAALIGRWEGRGRGSYPTTDPFTYAEEMVFESVGEPYLLYSARSWAPDDQTPIHFERGFFFPGTGPGRVELALAHPLGVTEIAAGTVSGGTIELTSTVIGRTPSGSPVTGLDRRYQVEGDSLTYEVDMAMKQVPMVFHVRGQLRRMG